MPWNPILTFAGTEALAALTGRVGTVETDLPDLVADALALDGTPALAAAAAVDAEILGRDLLEGADILEDDIAFAVVDEDGRRTWLEAASDGGLTNHAVEKIGEHITGAVEQDTDITGLSFAVVDEDGRRTWLEADDGGKPSSRALELIGEGLGEAVSGVPLDAQVSALLRTMAVALNQTTTFFSDDFERPDTAGSTSLTDTGLGDGWRVTGTGFESARIEDGHYVTSGNCYAYRILPFVPIRVSALAAFPADSRNVTLLTAVDETIHPNSVHVVFSRTACFIQVRIASATTTLATIPLVVVEEQPYELAIEIRGTEVIAFRDGLEIGRGSHASVPSLNGHVVTWQEGPTSEGTGNPRIDVVSAAGVPTA